MIVQKQIAKFGEKEQHYFQAEREMSSGVITISSPLIVAMQLDDDAAEALIKVLKMVGVKAT